MSDMRGLTIVIATADAERFALALAMASSAAALGSRARLYAHDQAVTMLAATPALDEALAIGVEFIVCQTALADHHLALPEFAEGGGLVGLLASLGDDRLVTL